MPARLHPLSLLVLILAGPAAAAEPPSNPEYAAWNAYRPGATVTHRTTYKIGGVPAEQFVRTVLKLTADDRLTLAAVEYTVADGKEKVHGRYERTVPKNLPADTPAGRAVLGGLDLPPGKVDTAPEEIEVSGKKYKCQRATVIPKPGFTVTRSVVLWFADGVPGRVVRSAGPDYDFGDKRTRMDEVKTELVEVKADPR